MSSDFTAGWPCSVSTSRGEIRHRRRKLDEHVYPRVATGQEFGLLAHCRRARIAARNRRRRQPWILPRAVFACHRRTWGLHALEEKSKCFLANDEIPGQIPAMTREVDQALIARPQPHVVGELELGMLPGHRPAEEACWSHAIQQ
jgi:hypothetical protein